MDEIVPDELVYIPNFADVHNPDNELGDDHGEYKPLKAWGLRVQGGIILLHTEPHSDSARIGQNYGLFSEEEQAMVRAQYDVPDAVWVALAKYRMMGEVDG